MSICAACIVSSILRSLTLFMAWFSKDIVRGWGTQFKTYDEDGHVTSRRFRVFTSFQGMMDGILREAPEWPPDFDGPEINWYYLEVTTRLDASDCWYNAYYNLK